MPDPEAEIYGASIVFVGSFNPTIFQPAWLASQGLIRQEQAEAAEINVVHPEVVAYSTDWLQLEASRDRFLLGTSPRAETIEPLRDLAISLFTILKYTPIWMVGLNQDAHYRVSDEDAWHRVGHTLAPPDRWEGVLVRPGMKTVNMEGARPDEHNGYIRVAVEPSVRIPVGVYLSINDHYLVAESADEADGAMAAVETVRDCWESSIQRAESITKAVLGLA